MPRTTTPDFYMATGDNKSALENFSKALKIKDLPSTKEKLKKLKEIEVWLHWGLHLYPVRLTGAKLKKESF